ncbi:MAG: type II secretion system minor pseudopilin GspI [Planctomycetaceae bacterium]|nr:type II secretion system minor pseudopilin GspI [Planctomycetaceae bacterium]
MKQLPGQRTSVSLESQSDHRRCLTPSALGTRPRKHGRPLRRGVTLLEVLISLAIFVGSLAAILQLLSIGNRARVATRLETEAMLRCESKMSEIVAGVVPATTTTDQPFDDDPDGEWKWSASVAETATTGLLQVDVSVEFYPGGANVASVSETLSRYLRDPQLFIDAALAESEE